MSLSDNIDLCCCNCMVWSETHGYLKSQIGAVVARGGGMQLDHLLQ